MMKVTQTIQSTDTSNPPTPVVWYTGDNRLAAVLALAQASAEPDNQFFTVLSVRIDFFS